MLVSMLDFMNVDTGNPPRPGRNIGETCILLSVQSRRILSCHSGSGVLIFQTDNHGATARVDVYPTGEVYWIAGGAQVPWPWYSAAAVAFSGTCFALHGVAI